MKRLIRFLKPYRLQVFLGPVFKLIEAIFELIVPRVMADMIDVGVARGDTTSGSGGRCWCCWGWWAWLPP